jgi:hypothetical protein
MTNDKEPMTKGASGFPFVIGSLSFVIPWSAQVMRMLATLQAFS